MYSAFGLLTADNDFTMKELARRLAVKFPAAAVGVKGEAVVVSFPDWEIHLALNESATVLDESRVMAGHIGGALDATEIAGCTRRVELASDLPDPRLEHFNDYLLAVEVLQSFRGLIAVDPKEPSLL